MNNFWIDYSDRNGNIYLDDYSHEDWLDYLNLYETSWMLFVWHRRNANNRNFGWPPAHTKGKHE